MKPEQLHRLRTREPFVPFRLRLQDGRTFEVLRRDLILVTRNSLSIGTFVDPVSGFPEQIVHISPVQIVGAEDLQPAT